MIHLVTLDFPPDYDGGVASWVEDLARGLVAAGAPVVVYAKHTGISRSYDETLPFPVMRMRGRSWGRWQGAWALASVGPLLKPGDQLLFATWPLAALLGPLAASRGIRSAVAFHGSDLTRLEGTPRALRRVLTTSHALLPVSEFLADLLRERGATAIRVMPSPVPLSGPGVPGQGLIAVARLNRLKGIDRGLRLAAALGWPIQIVGDGAARPELEALATELGADATFSGRLPRGRTLDAYAGKAASLLLPRVDDDGSGAEGLGLVLLEAMGRGVPAVGCRTGGVPEAVGPGLLLDEPDDAAASAASLRAWLSTGPRGLEAWRWVSERHGAQRAAAAAIEVLAS